VSKALKLIFWATSIVTSLYAMSGYVSATLQADTLRHRANNLISSGKGPDALNKDRLELLLLVQDPAFYQHDGVDNKTAGAGLTTVTQSLSKRLAFNHFKPGIAKLRQTSYALALERQLSKTEILALFLETIPMGTGPQGWTVGFFEASHAFYGMAPNDLNTGQYIELVSVMIAPALLSHKTRNKKFTERINRITRLSNGDCTPEDNNDVWLAACASQVKPNDGT